MANLSECTCFDLLTILTKIGEWILFRIFVLGHRIGRHFVHFVLAVFYFNRRRVVPPIKNELLLKSANQLAADIREGRIKSEDVVMAYIERIKEVEPYINATTYNRFEDAMKEAKLADELIQSGKVSRRQLAAEKPLLGIPLSVKFNIKIKDVPLTAGSLDSKDVIATEDADAIKFMKKAGAIILVSTNAPEKAMGIESYNKLYGRTNNPYDTTRTPGGSSGGEGALIGAGASLIGLGNDTCGSLRIPPFFCGVFGHLPSEKLVSPRGQLINTGNITTIGPMCRYAEDLVLSMKVLTMDKVDSVQFDRNVDFSKIKIYYLNSIDSTFKIPVDDEIKQAISKVTSYFHSSYATKILEPKIPLLRESNSIFWHLFISYVDLDEVKKIVGIPKDLDAGKELLLSLIGLSKYTFNIPFILKFLKFPLWYKEAEVPRYTTLAQRLKQQFDEILDENSVLLCPTLPQTAYYHTEARMVLTDSCYLSVWNILGMPATQCPLGLNRQGLPLGLQIVAKTNNDSLTLAMARELERAFGGWVTPRRK